MLAVVPSQIISYIDSRFPQVAAGKGFYLGRDYAPILSHFLKLIDSLPSGVVTLEGDAFAEFGEAVEAVRVAVHAWNNGDNNHRLEKIPGRKTGLYSTNVNPLEFIRKHLLSLRDNVLDPEPTTLLFITDPDLREDLQFDIAAADRSFNAGDWKGCTVVAGSVAEALLLWALETIETKKPESTKKAFIALVSSGDFRKNSSSDLYRWGLSELTEVALRLNLISKTTAEQCRIAKDFRNLIHPGRTLRLAQHCNVGTAHAASAAFWNVITDLSSREF